MQMNNFTKKELMALEELCATVDFYEEILPERRELYLKIRGMIKNYCEHESYAFTGEPATINGIHEAIGKCSKCGYIPDEPKAAVIEHEKKVYIVQGRDFDGSWIKSVCPTYEKAVELQEKSTEEEEDDFVSYHVNEFDIV